MPTETWAPVSGTDVEVSDRGRCRTTRDRPAFGKMPPSLAGTILTPDAQGRVWVQDDSLPRPGQRRVAKMVWWAHSPDAAPSRRHLAGTVRQLDPAGGFALDNLVHDAKKWESLGRPKSGGGTTRKCITCRKPFRSTWAGHRMCENCRSRGDDGLPEQWANV